MQCMLKIWYKNYMLLVLSKGLLKFLLHSCLVLHVLLAIHSYYYSAYKPTYNLCLTNHYYRF